MPAFYNEIDPYAVAWLRNLAAAGHLPAGTVDERSILDLEPDDLRPFRQCHFFAGIGGWPFALALAGWPDDREVWTGSCPCQPLSSAGQRRGHADERHLWPAFYRLIAECRPATVFGEQVTSKDGREWLAGVRADLEHLGYAVGAADLSAAGVGAPHIRQRLFWVADRAGSRGGGATGGMADAADGRHQPLAGVGGIRTEEAGNITLPQLGANGATGGLGDAGRNRHGSRDELMEGTGPQDRTNGQTIRCGPGRGGLADADGGQSGDGHLQPGGQHGLCSDVESVACLASCAVGVPQPANFTACSRLAVCLRPSVVRPVASIVSMLTERPPDGVAGVGQPLTSATVLRHERPEQPAQSGLRGRLGDADAAGPQVERRERGVPFSKSGPLAGETAIGADAWSGAVWLPCLDGKARRVEPGIFPLADGVSARVGRLRAYGNAIVPQAAAAFVKAFLEK